MSETKSHIFSLSIYDGGLWARFGSKSVGFSIVNKRKHPPLFSERYGYTKTFRIGKYGITKLKHHE